MKLIKRKNSAVSTLTSKYLGTKGLAKFFRGTTPLYQLLPGYYMVRRLFFWGDQPLTNKVMGRFELQLYYYSELLLSLNQINLE